MVLENRKAGPRLRGAEAAVILLDTHAAIWLVQGHRRARGLNRYPRLYLSPASLLELQVLIEAGRIRLAASRTLDAFRDDDRFSLDEPSAGKWFSTACELGWTRDPFDRLLVAHARVRRWRLATADEFLLQQMPGSEVVSL